MIKTISKNLAVLVSGICIWSGAMASENDERAQKAKTLLSAQLGGNAEITTESVETVTWPSGAMGCPKPDMNYTQSLVEGYRVVLSANGRQYFYHGRKGGDPFYCAKPESSQSWIMDR
jgi:hypothetical protein